jgi:integrase
MTPVNRVWFDENRIQAMPDDEKEYFSGCTIMYQTGKGVNHIVPVIVPADTVPALRKITDVELRRECCVLDDNPYLFPSSLSSDVHVSGWHTISRVYKKAGVKESEVTATKMRHLTSTLYAGLDMPEAKRHAFYRHMGHSKSIYENIYQAPLAEVEMREVGSILTQFGENSYFPCML